VCRRNAFFLVAGLLLASVPAIVFASGADVPDYRQNGWASPVDYRSHESCFQFDQYSGHVGDDLCRPADTTSIVAIADGCVEDYGTKVSGYGGVGISGGVILLRHYTTDGGVNPVFTVYGHDTPDTAYLDARKCGGNAIVKKGDKIATVHSYYGEGGKRMDHLHIGTRPNEKESGRYEYRGNSCFDSSGKYTRPDHCGWTEPFAFLMSHHPATLLPAGEQGLHNVGD